MTADTFELNDTFNEIAQLNERINLLEEALRQAIKWIERLEPGTNHEGPCGPESGCDTQCMDAASAASDLQIK